MLADSFKYATVNRRRSLTPPVTMRFGLNTSCAKASIDRLSEFRIPPNRNALALNPFIFEIRKVTFPEN